MRRARLMLFLLYFLFAFGILFLYGDRRYLCASSNSGRDYSLTTVILAFACTLWSVFASLLTAVLVRAIERKEQSPVLAILIATLIATAGFVSTPFWIYRGYGHFFFEHTWADVSCFFEEGSGMAFPFVVAPVLAGGTLAQEWFLRRIQKKFCRRLTSDNADSNDCCGPQ
jgi:heme/copper-type cytochrome/quinol oxidase subunit 3